MLLSKVVGEWRRGKSHGAEGQVASQRPGWKALVPLMMFVVCVMGSGESGGGEPPSEPTNVTCPQYNPSTFPEPSAPSEPVAAGTIAGSFSVSQTGEAEYTIPLVVPPGRAGMEPSLSISYNSGAGQGIVGVGFGLHGFSAITRCGSNLAQDGRIRAVSYDTGDHFCLDGVRLVQRYVQPAGSVSIVEYRTFPDTFKKVVAYYSGDPRPDYAKGPDYFEVFTKAGRILRYGGTADSRAMARDGVFASWWISREADRHDNAIEYAYQNDLLDGYTTEHYPLSIHYTSHGVVPASRSVTFTYEKSTRHRTFYSAGMMLQHSKLLSTVSMKGPDDKEVRSYLFNYSGEAGTLRPILEQLWECAGGECKPPTRFTWTSHSPLPLTRVSTHAAAPPDPTAAANMAIAPWLLADVTGDGLDDVVISALNWDPAHGIVDYDHDIWRVAPNAGEPHVFSPVSDWASINIGVYPYSEPYKGSLAWSGTPFDYDMDGRKDFLLSTPNRLVSTWQVLHSLPGGGFEVIDTGITHGSLKNEGRVGVLLADVNGDGASDLIECDNPSYEADDVAEHDPADARWTVRFWQPNGVGFAPQAAPIPMLDGYWCDGAVPGQRAKIKLVDMNADGKTDLLVPSEFPDGPVNGCSVAGSCHYGVLSYEYDDIWSMRYSGLPVLNGVYVFPDVNGDGLPDAVLLGWSAVSPMTYINTGRGFDSPVIDWSFSPVPDGWNWAKFIATAQLIDFNGDGQVDILLPMNFHCQSTVDPAACWVVLQSSATEPGKYSIEKTGIPFSSTFAQAWADSYFRWGGGFRPIGVSDVDGDGRHDIVVPEPELGHIAVYKSDGPQDLLETITDGMSPLDPDRPGFVPTVKVKYGNLVDYSRTHATSSSVENEDRTYLAQFEDGNDCTYPRACVVGSRRVVSQYLFNNGANQERSFSVRYRDGRFDHLVRAFLGFGARIVIDDDTQAGSVEFFDNTTYELSTYPYAGHKVRSWSWTPGMPNQVELSYGNTRYGIVPSDVAPTYFTLPLFTRKEQEEGQFSPSATMTYFGYAQATESTPATILSESWHITTNSDKYGNILGEIELTDGVDETTVTNRSFSNDPDSWLIGRLDTEEVCSSALGETQCRKTRVLLRDQYGEVVKLERGDPNDIETKLTVGYQRDDYGNVTLQTADDAFGHHRSACISYDGEHIFPYAARNALGHTRYTDFEPGLGALRATVDPNGLTTTRDHDAFGRVAKEWLPDGTMTEFHLTRTPHGGPQGDWWELSLSTYSPGHGTRTVTYDSMGRPVLAWTRPPLTAPGSYIWREVQYDALGRVARTSLPWESSDPPSSRRYHEMQYDGAGRLAKRTTPWNSTITYAYEKNTTYITDSAGTTSTRVDELGRRVEVSDKQGKITSYKYGPFSGLRSVTNIGHSTVTVRDAYGRVRESWDPDRHGSTMSYNGFGEVLSMDDAMNRHYEFAYDALGRLVERVDPDGATTWDYDTKPHGIGLIGRVTSPGSPAHVKDYTYDKLSRLKGLALTIGSDTFAAGFDYDSEGRLATVTYPTAGFGQPLSVARDYDLEGNVIRLFDATTGEDFWQLLAVDRTGKPAHEKLGNGVSMHREHFYEQGMLRGIQTELVTSVGTTTYQSLRYTYDDRLNTDTRVDLLQGGTGHALAEVFEYDSLDRLTCSGFVQVPEPGPNVPPPPKPKLSKCDLELTYAANGNIEHKSDVGTYKYHVAHPHAVETAGADLFGYDAVGNQVSRPGATIEYNAFDLPRRITKTADGTVIDLDYDGDQSRIRKTTSSQETIYLEGLYERVRDNEGKLKHHYYVPAGSATLVITRVEGMEDEHAYIHPDALGSPDVITNKKGGFADQQSFDAFGARRNHKWGQPPNLPYSAGVNVTYTGHEPDDEVGLINMRGRIYDPRVARFLQTDPLVSRPGFSQGWNAYSYVLNNPMKWVDPSGFEGEPPPQCDDLGMLVYGLTPQLDVSDVVQKLGQLQQMLNGVLAGLEAVKADPALAEVGAASDGFSVTQTPGLASGQMDAIRTYKGPAVRCGTGGTACGTADKRKVSPLLAQLEKELLADFANRTARPAFGDLPRVTILEATTYASPNKSGVDPVRVEYTAGLYIRHDKPAPRIGPTNRGGIDDSKVPGEDQVRRGQTTLDWFVGTVHSHPGGGGAEHFSEDDLKTFRAAAAQARARGGAHPEVGVHFYLLLPKGGTYDKKPYPDGSMLVWDPGGPGRVDTITLISPK